jgi:hypothetical protein
MDIMLLGLAATGSTLLLAPLAIVSAGIRRQERTGSLTSQPSGPAAALTRKMLALRTTPLSGTELRCPASQVRKIAGQVRP